MTPAAQSMLRLQSDASKATSTTFAQYLNAHLGPATTPAYGVARQSIVATSVSTNVSSQNIATTTPASSPPASSNDSPTSIAAQLLAANQPPADQQLTPLTGPLYSPTYMQQFTFNGFVNEANQQNQQNAALYQLDMNNWALNETQRQGLGLPSQPPPAAPKYVAVNDLGYDQWWSSLANLGNPAPVDFINPIAT